MTKPLFYFGGHGGADVGATNGKNYERDLVRQFGDRLKHYGGDNVILGDPDVKYVSNKELYKDIPKDAKVLEGHMDSVTSSSARGGHVIIKKGIGGADEWDKNLAAYISSEFPGRSSTIVERDDLASPTYAYNNGLNYRLVEFCFISNDDDLAKFISKMDSIAQGVLVAMGIDIVGTKPTETPEPEPTPEPEKEESSGYTGNSLVDYLKSTGQDSSYENRAKLAKANGISNYTGTATQNTKLLGILREEKSTSSTTTGYTGNSIVDYLKSIGQDSSYENRAKLAKQKGMTSYGGTAEQNTMLLKLLRGF